MRWFTKAFESENEKITMRHFKTCPQSSYTLHVLNTLKGRLVTFYVLKIVVAGCCHNDNIVDRFFIVDLLAIYMFLKVLNAKAKQLISKL